MRVPNEKKVGSSKVEGTFPADLQVYDFEFKPGWKIEFKKDDKFDFEGENKLKFSGTWTVKDDKHVELKYTLTDDHQGSSTGQVTVRGRRPWFGTDEAGGDGGQLAGD